MNQATAASEALYEGTEYVWRKVSFRLMPLLIVCYLFAHLDRINIGFAKSQMSSDLAFSETVYGFGAGLLFVSYAMFSVPSNLALVKFGPRRWIAFLMFAWGAMSTAMFLVTTPMEFYVIRFCLGAAEAGFFPGILYYINCCFPKHYRGRVTALFALAVPIAGILGGPLSGGIIVGFHHLMGLSGWQWMFLIEGFPVVLLGLVVWKYLPDTLAKVKWLSPEEKSYAIAAVSQAHEGPKASSFREIICTKNIWVLVCIYFAVRLSVNTTAFWLPTFIHGTGIGNDGVVGLLSAIPYIFGAGFMIFMGRSSDLNDERRWHLSISLLMAAIGLMVAGAFPTNTWIVMIALIVLGMGSSAALSMFWQLPPTFIAPAVLAGGLGLISSFGSIASFLAPSLIGWVRDTTQSSALALYVLGVLIAIGAGLVFATPKDTNR
ncbi:MFS transporter [Pseudomonas syringae]|uniref:MFS transporter n=1 Tax=Pseudomonas syringae TaxID=317 RepID=UPI001F32E47C|nr:MFS transporter [Pseudomonas syringae]